MGSFRTLAFSALGACALACAPATNPPEETPDAGETPTNECVYPTTGYGSSVGKKFEPFVLPDCDGNDYDFVNDGWCDAKLTVLSIAAEWCSPCQQESSKMTEYITRPYKDRGVRVIQVVIQNKTGGAPDSKLCKEWVDRFNLENVELIDPEGLIAGGFPSGSLPSTLVVDRAGIIRHREDGFSSGDPFVGLRAKLDELLAE